MSNVMNIPIDKLMLWSGNKWIKYEYSPGKTTLRMHYDQLMLISHSKMLESLNMNSKLRGVFKEDVLILVIGMPGQEMRKLKFQIKLDVDTCIQTLGKHFPVVKYDSLQTNNLKACARYRNIDEMFKKALTNEETGISVPLPSEYENFLKICLLDPAFPQCVKKTEEILHNILNL